MNQPKQLHILLVGKFSTNPAVYTYPSSFIPAFESAGALVSTFNLAINIFPWIEKICFRLGKFGAFIATHLLNKRLIDMTQKIRPDILFIIKGTQITASTLRTIKKMNQQIQIMHFYPDNPFCFWNGNSNAQVLNTLPYIDLFLIWSKQLIPILESAGCRRVAYFPFAFDPTLYYPSPTYSEISLLKNRIDPGALPGMTKTRNSSPPVIPGRAPESRAFLSINTNERSGTFTSDVAFIGTWDIEREALLLVIIAASPTINLAIWGNRWHEHLPTQSPLHPYIRGKAIYKETLLKAFAATKIVLNFMRPQNLQAHNMRTLEVLATGSFLLTQKTEEQTQFPFIEDFNIACFADAEDLVKKIAFYVNQDSLRKVVALRGLALAQEFTLQAQVQSLLTTLAESGKSS